MRYGIIADIHGNLEALEAVIEALSREKIDRFVCAGDIVGYGADPVECVARVKALKPAAVVAGNHEWGVLGLMDLEYFNDYARAAILWTGDRLDKASADYIGSLKLIYEDTVMTVVHGTLDNPERFDYIFDGRDARSTLESMKTGICFVGHSHVPGVFGPEDGLRRVVNVGSVGQPRDGDPRAAYAVYDDASKTVAIKRAGYDIKKARDKILAAGLPEALASRLLRGR